MLLVDVRSIQFKLKNFSFFPCSILNMLDKLCLINWVDPPIFQKILFFGVKRDMIQNKARTWKQGL